LEVLHLYVIERKRMKTRRWLVAVGVLIALVAAALAVWIFTRDEPKQSSAQGSRSSVVPSSSSLLPSYPPPNASKLADALNGSDKKAQMAFLPEAFQTADWSPGDVVPDGKTLVIDQASFGSNGSVGWLIGQYKMPNGTVESEMIIHLEYRDGQWLVVTFEGK
jgi:hypothetical protein